MDVRMDVRPALLGQLIHMDVRPALLGQLIHMDVRPALLGQLSRAVNLKTRTDSGTNLVQGLVGGQNFFGHPQNW